MSAFLFGRPDTDTRRPAPAPAPVADVVWRADRALAAGTVTDDLVAELVATLVATRTALSAKGRA